MDSFCDSVLWNKTLLLENSWPEFTRCFQETVLTIIPCGWLWVTSAIHFIYLHKHVEYIQLPTSCIYLAKLLFSFCLAFVCAIHLLVPMDKVVHGDSVPASLYTSRCIWIASFVYAGIIQRQSQRSGINSPCIVFIFWTISLVCHIVPVYTAMMLKSYDSAFLDVGLTYLTLMLILVQFILHCFGERNYTMLQANLGTFPCPSVGASFPSKLVFQWAFRMVYKGYKKSVQISDLSDLPPYMQCRNIVPEFITVWKNEILKIRIWRDVNTRQESDAKLTSFVDDVIAPSEKTRLLSTQKNARTKIYDATDMPFASQEKKDISLYKMLLKIYCLPIFKAQIVGLGSDMLSFVNPLLLEKMIDYTKNKAAYPHWHGFVISGAFFCVVFLTSVMSNYRFYSSFNIGTKVKTCLTAAVYKKSLTMSADSRQKFTVGTTVNLMAVDCPRFLDLSTSLWGLISCPLQLMVAFYMLYNQLGISFVAGIIVLIMLIPVNGKLSNCSKNAQAAQIALKDQRVKLMNEMLNGIRVLKLYAWEASFQKSIAEIREKEIYQLKKGAVFQALNVLSWLISPILMTSVTFIMFVLLSPNNTLTPTTAFVSLSIFNMIKQPMNSLPNFISSMIQCHVSMRRLREYLSGDDLEGLDTTKASDEFPVVMYNGTYSWELGAPPVLRNMTAWIPRGKLVAVVGQVGAGKSSFLSALLGEMNTNNGWASIKGTIGYVPQQAWIQNKSLRDNILFGKRMNTRLYKQVITACALDPDIELLPGGELTEIGEKGINLSGGQKQRISLARAVYQDSDVFLLDDPLSAVDAHVGKHIFDNVLGPKGIIREKTRVLVTHGIHWLPMVDSIIVVDKGRVTEAGSYEELMSHHGSFAQFVKTYLLEHKDDGPEGPKGQKQVIEKVEASLSDEDIPLRRRSLSTISESNISILSETIDHPLSMDSAEKLENVLIQDERSETGKVKKEVFLFLLRAFGYSFAGGVVVFLLLYNGVNIGGSIWLSVWTSDPFLQNVSNRFDYDYTSKTEFYLGIYCGFNVVQVIGNTFFLVLLMVQFVNASQRLHNRMLDNILHQNMAFFDTTPLGRILNRFSRDVDVTDTNFSRQTRICLQYLFSIISIVIVISYTSPLFLAVMVPIFSIYVIFQKFYIPSSRQFRRLESITRSPIFSHFAETINGASSIRAFQVTDRFFQDSLVLVDTNTKCFYTGASSARWLRIRLEILGNLIVQFTALFAVLSESASASLVGLSISYALQVTNMLNILVQNATQLETNTVSVERILEYSSLSREPLWVVESSKPPPNWPQHGQVEFCRYSTRYRPGLDLVLKWISFTINPGEKIGVVGRTGAGKSSLSLSLFRVIEAAEGSILIDGVDISTLGLHDLRSRLTILPQDPVLFSGTLRFNLDPFSNYGDEAVWTALDNAHMGDFVRDMPGGLQFVCEEGGQNLSVGQRQLVCLARSLLRKTKILVLDEATAAVDLETDHLLQMTIREAFKDCTVLTVAHRLKTVVDYDRILVLSQGQIVEFDTPRALLDDDKSVFHGMAKESRLV